MCLTNYSSTIKYSFNNNCYRYNNETQSHLDNSNIFFKKTNIPLTSCMEFAEQNTAPYFIQTDYNKKTKKTDCYIPRINDFSNNISNYYSDINSNIKKIEYNDIVNTGIFNSKLNNCGDLSENINNFYNKVSDNNDYFLYKSDYIDELQDIIDNKANSIIKPNILYNDINSGFTNIENIIINLNNNFSNNECESELTNNSLRDISNLIISYINNNNFITQLDNINKIKKYEIEQIKKINQNINYNRKLLNKYLSQDNGNNGRLDDIIFNKNIKIFNNLLLLLIIIIISFICVKKYK